MSRHFVTRKEMDTILAALRLSQQDAAWIADGEGLIRNIAEDHGDALTNDEIDALVEKLNPPEETITPTQRKALTYLYKRGACCPHCGGPIRCMPGKALYDSNAVVQRVECQDCGEEWNDVYKLAAVTTVDGDLIASIPISEEQRRA